MRTSPKIGICILAYNSAQVVAKCIRSTLAAVSNLPHEIVVVDNNSADDTVDLVRRAYPQIPIIANETNMGYSAGNNAGGRYLRARDCDYVAFLNPDVVVSSDTLARMLQALIDNPSAGCVGGVPMDRGSVFTGAFRSRPTFLEKVLLYGTAQYLPILGRLVKPLVQRLSAQHYISPASVGRGRPVYAVSGGCILFPAAVFAQIGGFDEATFLFQEEFVISERLRHLGYQVIAAPDAAYEHAWGHSRRSQPLSSFRHFIRSEQHLVRNYYRWGIGRWGLLLFIRYSELGAYAFVWHLRRHWGRRRNVARNAA